MIRVVKYLKYKYLKYVFQIRNMYFVFCILGRLKNVSCILYLNTKILVFEYLKYIQHVQIQFRLISSLYMASQ